MPVRARCPSSPTRSPRAGAPRRSRRARARAAASPCMARCMPYRWVFTTTTSAAVALRAGRLGEALLAHRAARRAGALVPADAHRGPRSDAGLERELGAIAGLGVLGPRHEPAHLVAHGGRCCGVDTEIELTVLARLHLRRRVGGRRSSSVPSGPSTRSHGRACGRGTAGPSPRADPATPSSPSPRRSCGPRRSRGRGTRASCRCRCPPARRDVGASRSQCPPRRPSRADLRDVRRRRVSR